MGGNLFKDQETRRIESKEEYNKLIREISNLFFKKTGITLSGVKSYRSKESFGDIDFLCSMLEKHNTNFKAGENFIFDKCKEISDHVIKNGEVISFLYKQVQIDLILIKLEHLNTAHFFYDYNDLGLLLGKLCYYNRLTLGPTGLRLKVYSEDGNKKLMDEVIFHKVEDICNYMGISYSRWSEGFDTMEDVFDFVMSSSMYTEKAFNPDNWNSNQRLRDSKRINLKKFLDYVEFKKKIFRPTREETFELINQKFPLLDLKRKRDDILANIEKEKKAKEKFNGHIVKEKYGIDQKELGIVMKEFNSRFESKEDRINFVLTNSEDNIFKVINEIVGI